MSTLRGILSVSSAATATDFTFYDEFDNVFTFGDDERFEIHTVTVSLQTGAGSITIFNDDDGGDDLDSGEELLVVALSNLASFFGDYSSAPLFTPAGTTLKAISSTSATYDITVTGVKRRVEN